MSDVLIFVVVLAITLTIGIYIFNKFVERRMLAWVTLWSEKWDISTDVQIKALKHMQEWLHIGYVTPRVWDYKAWYKETYWKACKVYDPYFPQRMRMRYEAEDILYAAEMKKGINK